MANLNDSVNDINKMKDIINEKIINDDTDDMLTEEEKKQEPDLLLYNAISESSIQILQQETVVNLFKYLSTKFDEDVIKSIIELITLTMTQSAYNAIVFYDNLLKEELTNQFDNYGKHLNDTTAIAKSHDAVLQVFGQRITDLENINKIKNIKDSI